MFKQAKLATAITLMTGAMIGLNGCASAGKKHGTSDEAKSAKDSAAATFPAPQPNEGATGPFEAYGPPVPPVTDQPTDVYGPAPVQLRPVVLVLGPGMARGFSYVGVIRALNEAKIPIGAI